MASSQVLGVNLYFNGILDGFSERDGGFRGIGRMFRTKLVYVMEVLRGIVYLLTSSLIGLRSNL